MGIYVGLTKINIHKRRKRPLEVRTMVLFSLFAWLTFFFHFPKLIATLSENGQKVPDKLGDRWITAVGNLASYFRVSSKCIQRLCNVTESTLSKTQSSILDVKFSQNLCWWKRMSLEYINGNLYVCLQK